MSMLTIFLIIIVGVVLIGLAYLAGKHRAIIPIALTLLAIIFVGCSAKCFVDLNDYYSARGGVFGVLTGMTENNQGTVEVTDKIKFSLNNIVITQEADTDKYSATIYLNDIVSLETDKDYSVTVNKEPCSSSISSAGTTSYVKADYVYRFLDDNLENLCEDTLTFNIAFFAKYTEVKVSTNGGQTAVDNWNTYFSRNYFDVEVVPTEYTQDNEIIYGTGNVENYHILTYIVDEQEYMTQVFDSNKSISLISGPAKDGYTFSHWIDSDGNKVKMTSKFTEDTTLTAVYVELESLPWTFNGSAVTGYTGTSTDLVIPSSYSVLANGKIVEGDNVQVTEITFWLRNLSVNVTSITIPSSITVIETEFWYGASNLKYIEVNCGLGSINDQWFYVNPSGTKLVLNIDKVLPLYNYEYNVGGISTGKVTVYVHDDLVERYKASTGWSEFADQIHAISELN